MSNIEDSSLENFGFAFNDSDFSDRVLHIQIIPDDESLPANLNKYRFMHSPPQTQSNDSDCSVGVQLKSLKISSPILAIKSPFFYKLFRTGMIESQQRDVTLKIYSPEEAALMDLLMFMYIDALSATTRSDLVDVLMAAYKFEVKSCMKHCIQLLLKMPMSQEHALLYLELPLTAVVVQPLIDASKQYLVAHYRDFDNSEEEAMKLPLCAIEIVLGSEGLQVKSEDDVFDFILKWGRAHYPKLKERRTILSTRLVQLIRFPYMSCSKLKEVLVCADLNRGEVSTLVMEALFLKADVPYGQYTKTSSSERLYSERLVRVVQLEFPSPRCVIYFDLKKQEFEGLVALEELHSEAFVVGGRWFSLSLQWDEEQVSSFKNIGIFLYMLEGSEACTLDFEYAVMKKPSKEYVSYNKAENCSLTEKVSGIGRFQPFGVTWTAFMSDDSEYFIDGILHLRADITIINSQP